MQKIYIAQLNSTIGDIKGNKAKALKAIENAKKLQADTVVFACNLISGHPAKALIRDSEFVAKCDDAVAKIASFAGDMKIIGLDNKSFENDKYIVINTPQRFIKYSTDERVKNLKNIAKSKNKIVIFANLVGANDEYIFDGKSMIISPDQKVELVAKSFEEDFLFFDASQSYVEPDWQCDDQEEIYQALVLGIRDYITKNSFSKVAIGLSGGIDSAVVLALAARAVGNKNVLAVMMPSPYSSDESIKDATNLAQNLGVELINIPITDLMKSYDQTLEAIFVGKKIDTTEENLQARIRGNILMAISNKLGHIVLSCSNKSEFAIGYTTLYGDMAGSVAPIVDLLKTEVYKLANYINSQNSSEQIPQNIITKAPSAELRNDQKDSDDLPDYDELDSVIRLYMEEYKTASEIIAEGFCQPLVDRILALIKRNEYKRKQANLGLKISRDSLDLPITNRA